MGTHQCSRIYNSMSTEHTQYADENQLNKWKEGPLRFLFQPITDVEAPNSERLSESDASSHGEKYPNTCDKGQGHLCRVYGSYSVTFTFTYLELRALGRAVSVSWGIYARLCRKRFKCEE